MHGVKDKGVKLTNKWNCLWIFECSANHLPDETQNNKKIQEQPKERRQTKQEEGIKR